MKQKKKKHRLLIQISLVLIPVFVALIIAMSLIMYDSTVEGFLEAQNASMELSLTNTSDSVSEVVFVGEDYKKWCIEGWENDPVNTRRDISEEEYEKYVEFMENYDGFVATMEFVNSMPDDIRYIYLKTKHADLLELFNMAVENNKYDEIFLIDVDEQHFGLVLGDHSSANEVRVLGDRCDLDLSKHPALDNILKNNSDNIEFERSDDFPRDGDYYIAYKPVKVDGKVRAVMGIVYNWKSLRSTMSNSMLKARLLGIGGILLAMVILLILLYQRAIKPVSGISSALLRYTDDKDTPVVVGKMYSIKANNELGYLADVISDMALEIDLYNKETARMAAEKERAEKELYEAQVSIMVSQIQPHFMYNALSSIAMMCELDPEKAQEAIVAFADYLRGNMDSLKQKAPVPFTAELEHLKNYLAIEKLRFGKKLNIEYDIQTDDFVLPALSIQPLVENAVKHGVGQKKKGGTVTISTRETENAFEVIVSDDGVGFDVNAPKKDDGRSHVGMENTRKRLKDLCGAEVITESVIGEGTTTRVILPKEGQKHEDHVL